MNCGICGADSEHEHWSTLIDQNGHKWRVCEACVADLWGRRQQTIQNGEWKHAAIEYVLGQLAVLIGGQD